MVRMLLINSLAGGGHQLGLHGLIVATEVALEGEEIQPKHVEGRHAGRQEANNPEQWECFEGLPENFILAPEAS